MSIDLFNTQLVAQQFSSGKGLARVAEGAGSKSLHHSQGNAALESNDRGFSKTLERVSDSRQPLQNSSPPEHENPPVCERRPFICGGQKDTSGSLGPAHNLSGASSHAQGENNFVAGGQNFDLANINLMDLLRQLGMELLQIDGDGQLDRLAVQAEHAKAGVTPESKPAVSTQLPSMDMAKLEILLMHLQAGQNAHLSDQNQRLVQLISAIPDHQSLNASKNTVLQSLFQGASGKAQDFQIDSQNLRQALKDTPEFQPVIEKTTVADVSKKISAQLSRPVATPQNMESAAVKNSISGNAAEGDQTRWTRLDAGWPSKNANSGKNLMVHNLTEVVRPNSSASQETAQEIGQHVHKQILKADLQGNPVAKSEFTPTVLNPVPPANQGDGKQTVKITNPNPGQIPAGKIVAPILTAEPEVKDGGLLFNQGQNEVKTSEIKLVIPETEMLQKNFRSLTVNQIVQKAVLHFNNGQHEVRLDLKPDFLGHIRMQIITESQQVTVRILAESPMVKELIENNFQQLKSELQNHGLEIDELDVSVEDHADRHVADGKMAAEAKTKPSDKSGEQNENTPAIDQRADRLPPERIEGDTRIDFFA